ncbi:hypothetical protein AB0D08_02620 [Kitasatospora sp. NPDC048540]|uniref:hypothetical protein n=1 Tax=Kitasatospora sp. NPDC048540 TaxID=3155634 RepID=UPI0033FA55EC
MSWLTVDRTAGGEVRVVPGTTPEIPEPATTRPVFAQAGLDVAGAVLTWPAPGDPGPPTALVHDGARAQQWLWALYGPQAAAAVAACADGRSGPVTVPAGPADPRLSADATRLALGLWAARWWPASDRDGIPAPPADLLGLELAALGHRCQQLFDGSGDQVDDSAVDLLDAHRAAIGPLLRWWRTADDRAQFAAPVPVPAQVEEVLRLVDALADLAGLDGPELRLLREEFDGAAPAGGPREGELSPLSGFGALFARPGGYALAAGGPVTGAGAGAGSGSGSGRVIARGVGQCDWRRYPPGFVDAAEEAVTWTARAEGSGRRIEVEALAGAVVPADGVLLVAQVRVDGEPAGRVPLARRDDVWFGRADLVLPEAAAARIEVDVLLPGFGGSEDGPPAPAADREAVRTLARHRLSMAAGPVPYDSPARPFLSEIAATDAAEDF